LITATYLLSTQNIANYIKDKTDQQTGSQRKIKGKISPLDNQVAGQPPELVKK